MKKHLTHIAPLRAGLIIAVLNAASNVVITATTLTVISWTPHFGEPRAHNYMTMFLWSPAIHAGLGFAMGFLGAAIYNRIAKWTGGLILEFQDVPPENW